MSVKISGKVWELDIDPIDKLVLLALADHADHEGENVRPGHELLAAKTGLSEKTIGTKIEHFVAQGWIEIEGNRQGGRGRKRDYSIDIEQAPRRQYFIRRDEERAQKRAKQLQPLQPQKGEAASTFTASKGRSSFNLSKTLKVEAGDLKVEADGNVHDKERARLNRHEPSIESSECLTGEQTGNSAPLENPSDSFSVINGVAVETKKLTGKWSQTELALWAALLWEPDNASDPRKEKIRDAASYLDQAYPDLDLQLVRRAREFYTSQTPPKLKIQPSYIAQDYREIEYFLRHRHANGKTQAVPATAVHANSDDDTAAKWLADIAAYAAGQAPHGAEPLRELRDFLDGLAERSPAQERVLQRLREVLPRGAPAQVQA